jgi:hypothetical protein
MSGRRDSNACCAAEFSIGSHGFVISIDRPPMPARPRRIVCHTASSLFVDVYRPDSSARPKLIGFPSFERAAAETGSIFPLFGSRMNPSRTFIRSVRPSLERIIVWIGSYTFAVCVSAVASSWISDFRRGIPIGSPGSYTNTNPHPQPWSSHRYSSPPRAHPANTHGPTASKITRDAPHGDFPFFCGPTHTARR